MDGFSEVRGSRPWRHCSDSCHVVFPFRVAYGSDFLTTPINNLSIAVVFFCLFF